MPDLVQETRGPEKVELFITAEEQSHQVVEPDEMVHVGMRHKDMTEPQELSRRHMGNFPQIEQYRPPLEKEIDIESRIGEGPVDKTGMKQRSHVFPLLVQFPEFVLVFTPIP